MKCCICGKEIVGYGNNPYPIKEGRCCDECNLIVVVIRAELANQETRNGDD